MKKCDYCGRENDDGTTTCHECDSTFAAGARSVSAGSIRTRFSRLRLRLPGQMPPLPSPTFRQSSPVSIASPLPIQTAPIHPPPVSVCSARNRL